MKIYVAAPLFNEMELQRNAEINEMILKLGFETFLPQKDGGVVSKLIENSISETEDEIEDRIFQMDLNQMNSCDMLLFLLDGIALDEGSCFELGYMYAQGKPCIGYKTDVRNFGHGRENLMIQKSLKAILRNREQLLNYLANMEA